MLTLDDNNCDNADAVGEAIQNALKNICIEDAVIPREAQVCALQLLKSGVKIDSKTVHTDPLILFTRLTALIKRDGKVQENFRYEVTPEPMTLFRNGMMQKSGKLVIRNHLFNKYPSCDCPSSRSLVIDGECFVTQSKVVLWFLICRHHRFLYPIHLKLIFYV